MVVKYISYHGDHVTRKILAVDSYSIFQCKQNLDILKIHRTLNSHISTSCEHFH